MVPCIDCHKLLDQGTRCKPCNRRHQRERERNRPAYRRAYSDPVYQANRRLLLSSATRCNHCQGPLLTRGISYQDDSCKLKPEIDHILPLSMGGTNDLANLQVLCRECNLKKSNKTSADI